MNKQLAVQNTKLSTNLSDLRGQIMSEAGQEEADLFRGMPPAMSFHPPQSIDHAAGGALEGEEILERKKAWAELEREQTEVKRSIKSLMKFEPSTRAIDDPALADRVAGVRMNAQTYDTVEDMATEKRMQSHLPQGERGSKPASPAQPVSKPRTEAQAYPRHGTPDSQLNGSES